MHCLFNSIWAKYRLQCVLTCILDSFCIQIFFCAAHILYFDVDSHPIVYFCNNKAAAKWIKRYEVYTHCMLLEWNWSDVIVELLACFATCNNVHPSELFMGKVTQSIFCHTFVFALNYIPLQWWCFNETHEQFHIASVFILSIYLFGESLWHKCKWIYFGSTVFGFHRWIFAISICPSFDGCIIKTFFYLH